MGLAAQLLVVSPDSTVREAAQRCALTLGHTAFLARSLADARQTLTRVRIDLICLDSVLPSDEMDRFWRWLRSDHQQDGARVVFLAPPSATVVPAALPSFFRPERDGLIPKPLESHEMARVMARMLATSPRRDREADLLRVGSIALDPGTQQLLFATGGALALTPTELRLLRCLMQRPGEFVSQEELLETVWRYPPGTGGREVVRAHVSNLRRKLRSHGADPQLVRTIPYLGYGFVAGDAGRS
jgi:DNA-binding response OmpR family regulator